jgi:hypothetical protein
VPWERARGPSGERKSDSKKQSSEKKKSEKSKTPILLSLLTSSLLSFDQRRVSLDQECELGEALGGGGKHLGPGLRRNKEGKTGCREGLPV